MPQFRQTRILVCTNCGEHTLLPSRSPQGKVYDPPSWPTDTETLAVVCHKCGRLSDYSLSQTHFEEIPEDAPVLLTRTFRRVEFACDQQNCGTPIVLHLETEKDATDTAIKKRVLTSSPFASHGGQHFLTANCKLVRTDLFHY